MANYPNGIDTFTTVKPDDEMLGHASKHNNEAGAIVAIETELGENPSGSFDSVSLRLDDNTNSIAENAQTLSDLTTATLPLENPEDINTLFSVLSTQQQANEYFASEIKNKVSIATTWGQLAGIDYVV
jgi:hypothetical protein